MKKRLIGIEWVATFEEDSNKKPVKYVGSLAYSKNSLSNYQITLIGQYLQEEITNTIRKVLGK